MEFTAAEEFDVDFFGFAFVVADDADGADAEDHFGARLGGDDERADGFVVFALFDFVFFVVGDFVAQFAGEAAHFPTFVGEEVDFVFAVLDVFFELGVLAAVAFDLASDLVDNIKVIADVLFGFFGVDIEV